MLLDLPRLAKGGSSYDFYMTNKENDMTYINKTGQANLSRYLPEPATRGTSKYGDTFRIATTAATAIAGVAGNALTGGALGGLSGVGDFQDLISKQVEVQKEMQKTSMTSNIEKSKHETKMAPIRNLRVG